MVAVLGSVYITRAGQTFQPHPFLPLFPFCQVKTFNEACLMVRKPALELLHYLKNTNFAHPAVRYVLCILSCLPGLSEPVLPPSNVGKEEMLYFLTVEVSLLVVVSLTASALDGEKGTGKTLSLCHIIHFCAKQDWLILHIPDGKNFLPSLCWGQLFCYCGGTVTSVFWQGSAPEAGWCEVVQEPFDNRNEVFWPSGPLGNAGLWQLPDAHEHELPPLCSPQALCHQVTTLRPTEPLPWYCLPAFWVVSMKFKNYTLSLHTHPSLF